MGPSTGYKHSLSPHTKAWLCACYYTCGTQYWLQTQLVPTHQSMAVCLLLYLWDPALATNTACPHTPKHDCVLVIILVGTSTDYKQSLSPHTKAWLCACYYTCGTQHWLQTQLVPTHQRMAVCYYTCGTQHWLQTQLDTTHQSMYIW